MQAHFWTFEPFTSIDDPPSNRHQHRSSIHETRPVHARHAEKVSTFIGTSRIRTAHSRSEPVTLGNIKTGTMSNTNAQAILPMTMLYLPKFQGPGLNLLPTKKTRIKMGIVNATKAATAAMENRAPAASGPPNISKVMQIPILVLNQTALTGVLVCGLTR